MYHVTYDRQYWTKNISLKVSTCWTKQCQMKRKMSVQDALCWSLHKSHSVGYKKLVWTYVYINPDKTSHISDLNTLVPLHNTFPTSDPWGLPASLKCWTVFKTCNTDLQPAWHYVAHNYICKLYLQCTDCTTISKVRCYNHCDFHTRILRTSPK